MPAAVVLPHLAARRDGADQELVVQAEPEHLVAPRAAGDEELPRLRVLPFRARVPALADFPLPRPGGVDVETAAHCADDGLHGGNPSFRIVSSASGIFMCSPRSDVVKPGNRSA